MVGASFDAVEDQLAFAETESFPFALISDTYKSIGRCYHAEREPGEDYYEYGLPRRIIYLIDPEGNIAAAYDLAGQLAGQDLAGHAAQVLADIQSRSV